ncbi:FkbM family methyltransferase [Limnobacter parvus]|uniref:FkbM family methyltransferase n=1 Tax=Limnobacter parvus TaxID=2939690 RepID=A0ABT1XDL7_9BURK|nr:FkbM family methyltransferase [Limnobacter parvus]MCR2745229.1 FkbM family methyltransferase [Limnobacter parvus]
MISYAQNFEDVILWRVLKDFTPGFYVDVGANDPVVDSVTHWFYSQGWRGINVEPVPAWHARLAAERGEDTNLMVAIADKEGCLELFDIPDTGLSTFDSGTARQHGLDGYGATSIVVATTTLTKVLGQYRPTGPIHFLKIDVESYEAQVLESLDLVKYRPWIIVVEATIPRKPDISDAQVRKLLESANYTAVYFDGLNKFYVAHEQLDVLANKWYPPNVFDGFVLHQTLIKDLKIGALEAHLEKLSNEISVLNQNLDVSLAEASLLRAQVVSLLGSTSWRITRPLRWLGAMLRKLAEKRSD